MKFFLVALALVGAASAGTVAPGLKAAIHAGETTEAILELPQVIDAIVASPTIQFLEGDAKVEALKAAAIGATSAAQAPFLAIIQSLGLEADTFWGSNVVLVKGLTDKTFAQLAATPGDFKLRPQFTASIHPSVVNHGEVNITQNPQWGVAQIRAPQAWSVNNGDGCVAAIIDTGVNVGHVALREAFAGGAGAWMDPYYNTAGPTDQQGHGSHCAGTILGRANGVGVAPGARWVACRGLNHQGSGTEANLLRCAEWIMDAEPRPDVVSNSWGGGSGDNWYNSVVTIWRNAGIIPVFALGNSGPGCRSANSPGDQVGLIGVGSTARNDIMSSFSSRGPSTAGTRKPEVSAPGSDITSCGTGASNYVSMSGTSMATPHVAGAVCLIKTQNPSWNMAQVLARLEQTAESATLTAADRNCGLPGSGDFPNNAFGAGRINAAAAVGA